MRIFSNRLLIDSFIVTLDYCGGTTGNEIPWWGRFGISVGKKRRRGKLACRVKCRDIQTTKKKTNGKEIDEKKSEEREQRKSYTVFFV